MTAHADKEDKQEVNTLFTMFKTYGQLLLIAATFFVNFGMFRADYINLQKRLDDIEALKPEQIGWISEQHEKRITDVEQQQKSVRDTVFEMKTKIDVIASWVADQKEREKEKSEHIR
jgi:hypothetical protein